MKAPSVECSHLSSEVDTDSLHFKRPKGSKIHEIRREMGSRPFQSPTPIPDRTTSDRRLRDYVPLNIRVGTLGPYYVRSDLNGEYVRRKYGDAFTNVHAGASTVEKLFGITPGQAVTQIGVVDGDSRNAFFNEGKPHRITFHDELLDRSNYGPDIDFPLRVRSAAQHETAHLIDHRFSRISEGRFADRFLEIKRSYPRFFYRLNEKQFIARSKNGGHSEANHKELFATFTVTLLQEDWQQIISSKPKKFQRWYLRTLYDYKASIRDSAVAEGAPIRSLLESRIQSLRNSLEV